MTAARGTEDRDRDQWPSLERARRRGLIVTAIVAVCVGIAVQFSGALESVEGHTVDARYRMRAATPPADLVIVDVDDETFSELGRQWPFPRSDFARVARRLHRAGARQIVLDVQFTEPTTPDEDLALYDDLGRVGGAVLATTESDAHGATNVLGGDENLRRIDSVAGASDFPYESGGVIRRVPHSVGRLATIAVAVAEREGRRPAHNRFERAGAWLDFAGPPGTVPTVPFSSVYEGSVDPRVFRDKIVIVGTSAPSLHDLHMTPFGAPPMSGPELQANAIATVLAGMPLRSAPVGLAVLAIVALGSILPLAALRFGALKVALGGPLLAAAYGGLALSVFERGVVVAMVAPLLALLAAALGTVVAGYALVARERRRIATYNAILERKVAERTAQWKATQLEVVQRLGQAVDFRDQETGDHIRRMSELSRRLGLAAGMTAADCETLRHAAALHDVGKIAVPDDILLKSGKLDAEEWVVMKRHTVVGSELLAGSTSLLVQMAELIALTHHERWDGSGYPHGISGSDIPFVGRICAIADVFDALTSERPYKRAWSVDEARSEIARQSGAQFDPELVELFLALDLQEFERPAAQPPLAPAVLTG